MVFSACAIDSVNLKNEVDCVATSFVGTWEYQSTNGVVLDSITDIEITLSDDKSSGDIKINGLYLRIKSALGCTAGEVSGLLDESYELQSDSELHKRTTALVIFGSVSIYKKE